MAFRKEKPDSRDNLVTSNYKLYQRIFCRTIKFLMVTMQVASCMHGANVRICISNSQNSNFVSLTWVFVDLNLNLQSSDLHGSKNAQFCDYKHHKNTEKSLSIEKKWHPCLAASVRFGNLQVELYIQNNLIFAM